MSASSRQAPAPVAVRLWPEHLDRIVTAKRHVRFLAWQARMFRDAMKMSSTNTLDLMRKQAMVQDFAELLLASIEAADDALLPVGKLESGRAYPDTGGDL